MRVSSKRNKFGLIDIIEYLLVIFIILECRSVYSVSLDYSIPIDLIVVILTLSLMLCGLFTRRIVITVKSAKLAIILVTYLMIFFVANVISTSAKYDFIYKFLLFLPLITIMKDTRYSENISVDLLKKYAAVMVLLSFASLFFWLFGSTLKVISPSGILHYYWGIERTANSYLGVYIESAKDTFLFTNLYRNNGIFAEAPMHSLNLTLALGINLFICDSKSSKIFSVKNTIIILTVLSSLSMTGLSVIIAAIMAKVFFEEEKGKSIKRVAVIIAIIAVGILSQGLIDLKSDTNSYLVRMNDYYVGFKAWMDNFFFGGGYGIRNYMNYLESWRSFNTGYSNSLFWILAQGGVYLFLVYFIPSLLAMKRYIQNRDMSKVIFLCLVWYLVFTTSFGYQFILLLLVSYCYQDETETLSL